MSLSASNTSTSTSSTTLEVSLEENSDHQVAISPTDSLFAANATPPPSPDSRFIAIDEQGDGYDPTTSEERTYAQKVIVSKEISTVTKLLFTVSTAAILVNANSNNEGKEFDSWLACVEATFHLMAMILMIVGIYVRVKCPIFSKWLQKVGHLICLTCLMLIRTPLLHLGYAFFWFPPLLIFALITAIYLSG